MPAGLGLLFVVALLALLCVLAATSRAGTGTRSLLCTALALRFVGSLGYYLAFSTLYSKSDASVYLERAASYATRVWQGDFGMFVDPREWEGGRLWGTNFVGLSATVTESVVGASPVANYLVFSLAAFAGLYLFASAFRRSYPDLAFTRYARWIWLFPTLWFWSSSVSKEALLLLGFGLAFNGYVGSNRRIHWLSLVAGIALTFMVRPQVVALLVFSMLFAYWASRSERWNFNRILQSLLFLTGAVVLIRVALRNVGVEDTQGLAYYVQAHASSAATGRSSAQPVESGWLRIPLAAINILFQPFPWKISNSTALLSAIEIWTFWLLAWYRRKNIWQAIRHWRSDRLLGTAMTFVVMYSTLLGLVVVNLGIIARQRMCLFPFLFLFFEVVPSEWTPSRRATGNSAGRGYAPEMPPFAVLPTSVQRTASG